MRIMIALLLILLFPFSLHNTVYHTVKEECKPVSTINKLNVSTKVMQYKDIAIKWSKQTGVPAALILAIIDQESDGRPQVSRFEPRYKPSKTHYKEMLDNGISEKTMKTSYGLMQMMFPVAWGYGARSIEDLTTPDTAIRFGAAHLGQLYKKHRGDIRRIAGAYNGGGYNSKYALDVYKLYSKYSKCIEGV